MKIGFTGTQSVGKTSLVNAISELPEFKDYTFKTERSKYLRDLGIPLNTDSTIKGQTVFLAERAGELMNEKVITDRTVIDVMAFTSLSKEIPYYMSDSFEQFASNLLSEYDYIFYISPEGIGIEDNGVRETNAEYREEIDISIQNLITKYKYKLKNLVELKGTTEERIKQIKSSIIL